jgi:hypothetical protein
MSDRKIFHVLTIFILKEYFSGTENFPSREEGCTSQRFIGFIKLVVYMSLIDAGLFSRNYPFPWPGPGISRRARLASVAQTLVSDFKPIFVQGF